MLKHIKIFLKELLHYSPLQETSEVRRIIDTVKVSDRPYCPPDEGDLLYSLICSNGFRKCLETGFHTGSTALYMAAAVSERKGSVTSISVDDKEYLSQGLGILETSGFGSCHRMIHANSNRALPELFLNGERFEIIYMDGWKTFDHLAMEVYFFNQLLDQGGILVFDDSNLPAVRRAIRLLKRYYGFEEVCYSAHNQSLRVRLCQLLTTRSFHRPYRALTKVVATEDQPPFRDWHFDRNL